MNLYKCGLKTSYTKHYKHNVHTRTYTMYLPPSNPFYRGVGSI